MSLSEHEYRQWHERANDRLAALTSGETVQNDRLDDLDERINDLDETLNGNHAKGYDGLIKEIETLENRVDMLIAIMSPDALGNGGIKNRISSLENWRSGQDRWSETKWKFWTAVAIGLISTLGLILTNLPTIVEGFHKIAPNSPIYDKKEVKPQKVKRIRTVPLVPESQ